MCFINFLSNIKSRQVILLLVINSLIFGCGRNVICGDHAFMLEEGDLLFQDLDCGPLCDAIERVSTGYQGANLSHVGIVVKDTNNSFIVIEAVANGIETTDLQVFLDRNLDNKNRPKVLVGRLNPSFHHLIPAAIKNAFALKGIPYDKAFVINNDAYYCSELIYEIFLRANNNNPVFTLQPMTFKNPDTGVVLETWQEYFCELGVPVPQGQLGINPGGISCSPALSIIHAYGAPDGWASRVSNGI